MFVDRDDVGGQRDKQRCEARCEIEKSRNQDDESDASRCGTVLRYLHSD